MESRRAQRTASADSGAGFTLIELMVGIAVLAVLLTVGVPAFNDIIRNNRLTTQTNELVTSLNLARMEASRRGLPVAVCAANADQDDCAGAGQANWANGWLVFSDRGGVAGSFDNANGDELLQASKPVGDSMQLTTANFGFVRFRADGTAFAAAAFNVTPTQCTGRDVRNITLDLSGRISSSKVSC